MTLDKFLKTTPPNNWQKPRLRVESNCWFNNEVMRVRGPEASCHDPSLTYEQCDGACTWGPPCEECSQLTVYSDDCCAGRTNLCLVKECAMDK